jgi:hypothetical protein
VLSLLSLFSFLATGEDRGRYLGVPIPPASLKPDYVDQARAFAAKIAGELGQ